jgi:RNA polymerase sigma factor (sigma-70 family)
MRAAAFGATPQAGATHAGVASIRLGSGDATARPARRRGRCSSGSDDARIAGITKRRLAEASRTAAEQPAREDPATPSEIERLYAAIAALPPRQAAVVTLRKLMELDYADIAGLLGISVENCRSHCRLALQRLREELCDDAETGTARGEA